MDPALKCGLAFDIITKAQDWRDRAIVASVIAKYPIEDPENWGLAQGIAKILATAKSSNDRCFRLEKQTDFSGADLWVLIWLSANGFVSDQLFGFKWSRVLGLVSETIDSDMMMQRATIESRGPHSAILDIVRCYNTYIGSEAFNIERVFKMVTLSFGPKPIVEEPRQNVQNREGTHADHGGVFHELHNQGHQVCPDKDSGHEEGHTDSHVGISITREPALNPDHENMSRSSSPFRQGTELPNVGTGLEGHAG